jgi:hypothetical protein
MVCRIDVRASAPLAWLCLTVKVLAAPEDIAVNNAPSVVPAEDAAAVDAPSAAPATVAILPEAVVEVRVEGERAHAPQRMTRGEVRQIPGAFGDPFRAIEVLPGVTPIASGLPYFFVRGAPPGNVGYFFDGVALPALYHVAAGPGVIHPAFIDGVALYAGSYPAQLGRFSGGIVSADAAQPRREARGEASIRLVDSGAFVEIPFAQDKGNLMMAGRYSYTAAVLSLLVPEVEVSYWDYQARAEYQLSEQATLSLLGFGAFDFLAAENDSAERQRVYDVTFHRLDARYDRALGEDTALRLATTFAYDRTGAGDDRGGDILNRGVGARAALTHRVSPRVQLRSGADLNVSRLDILLDTLNDEDDDEDEVPVAERILPEPGFPEVLLDPLMEARLAERQVELTDRFSSRLDLLGGVWADTVLQPSAGVTFTPGLRFDAYDTGGSTAFALEPRVAARFELGGGLALLHDFGVAHQPPSFVVPTPGLYGDVDEGLQTALQSSAGFEQKLPQGVTASVTLFQNVILDATDTLGLLNLQRSDLAVDSAVDTSTAHSYGAEFYLRRSLSERLGGFLSYTLSRSTRAVGRLEGPSSIDRTHVLNVAAAYDLGRRWRFGARVAAYSGIPAEVAYPAAARIPPRTPWYVRLDWRLEKRWRLSNEGAWWAFVAEVLNTTLAQETLNQSCYAYGCSAEAIGPVTIPSLGVEASF